MGSQAERNQQGQSQMEMHLHRLSSESTLDKHFVMEAAQGELAEVELGQLAEQRASNPEVEEFGKRMVTDHTKAKDQLRQVASQMSVPVPTELIRFRIL
jgi:putative membrane protein